MLKKQPIPNQRAAWAKDTKKHKMVVIKRTKEASGLGVLELCSG